MTQLNKFDDLNSFREFRDHDKQKFDDLNS